MRSICIGSPGKMAVWILWDWHVFNMSWDLAICGCRVSGIQVGNIR
jgi:hypothetical protein